MGEAARRGILVMLGNAEAQVRGGRRFQADEIVFDLAGSTRRRRTSRERASSTRSRPNDDGEQTVAVRVNAIDTMWAHRGLVDVLERVREFVDCIVVPDVSAPGDLEFVDTRWSA